MPTLKDVARESGLTIGTVSRVLNNRGYISEKTRKKVYATMESIGYRPNELARSLLKQKTDTIGLIVPHSMHPYFAQMIWYIERAVAARNYKLLLYNSGGDADTQERYLEICSGNRVSGVIVFSGEFRPSLLAQFSIPVIAMERYLEGGTASIICDNDKGGQLAARHLIKAGCKNLIMLGGIEEKQMPADAREQGFVRACRAEGISFHVYKSKQSQYDGLYYYDYIEEALCAHPEADGVFASSDLIGAQLLQVLAREGKRVPRDVQVVGFDDVALSSMTVPALTTIRQPMEEMAGLAVDFLIKAEQKQTVPELSILPVKLVPRESTRKNGREGNASRIGEKQAEGEIYG